MDRRVRTRIDMYIDRRKDGFTNRRVHRQRWYNDRLVQRQTVTSTRTNEYTDSRVHGQMGTLTDGHTDRCIRVHGLTGKLTHEFKMEMIT